MNYEEQNLASPHAVYHAQMRLPWHNGAAISYQAWNQNKWTPMLPHWSSRRQNTMRYFNPAKKKNKCHGVIIAIKHNLDWLLSSNTYTIQIRLKGLNGLCMKNVRGLIVVRRSEVILQHLNMILLIKFDPLKTWIKCCYVIDINQRQVAGLMIDNTRRGDMAGYPIYKLQIPLQGFNRGRYMRRKLARVWYMDSRNDLLGKIERNKVPISANFCCACCHHHTCQIRLSRSHFQWNSRDTIIKDFNILKQTLMLEIRAICCQSF